jgi:hypothetical protein
MLILAVRHSCYSTTTTVVANNDNKLIIPRESHVFDSLCGRHSSTHCTVRDKRIAVGTRSMCDTTLYRVGVVRIRVVIQQQPAAAGVKVDNNCDVCVVVVLTLVSICRPYGTTVLLKPLLKIDYDHDALSNIPTKGKRLSHELAQSPAHGGKKNQKDPATTDVRNVHSALSRRSMRTDEGLVPWVEATINTSPTRAS